MCLCSIVTIFMVLEGLFIIGLYFGLMIFGGFDFVYVWGVVCSLSHFLIFRDYLDFYGWYALVLSCGEAGRPSPF